MTEVRSHLDRRRPLARPGARPGRQYPRAFALAAHTRSRRPARRRQPVLATRRVRFHDHEMSVTPSPETRPQEGAEAIVFSARSRFGRLILSTPRSTGAGMVIVDLQGRKSASETTHCGGRLQRRGRLGPTWPLEVVSHRRTRIVDYGIAQRVRIGTPRSRTSGRFGGPRPFRQLGLIDRRDPARMDALQLFDRVSLDFANREVRLQSPASAPPRRPASP